MNPRVLLISVVLIVSVSVLYWYYYPNIEKFISSPSNVQRGVPGRITSATVDTNLGSTTYRDVEGFRVDPEQASINQYINNARPEGIDVVMDQNDTVRQTGMFNSIPTVVDPNKTTYRIGGMVPHGPPTSGNISVDSTSANNANSALLATGASIGVF